MTALFITAPQELYMSEFFAGYSFTLAKRLLAHHTFASTFTASLQ